MQQIGRPKSPVRIPVVLSRAEAARLLEQVDPTFAATVALLYGAGLRLMECLRLRVKDLDFDRKILIVRAGKGRKDRAVMLPEPLNIPLRRQLEHSRPLWAEDRARRVPGVAMPDALAESIRAPLRAGPGTGYSRRLPCLLIRALAFVADIISMSKPSVARLRADPCGIGVRQSLPSSGTLHSLLLTALPFRCRSNHAICLLSASTRSA